LHYIKSGGSILIEADIAEWLFNIDIVLVFVRTIESDYGPIFNGVLPGFIQTKLFLSRKADLLETGSGKKLVQIYTSGKGTALILPGGFSKTILDTKIRRRNFSTSAENLPSERVARISKHTIREVIQKSLENLHFVRQLPFISLSPFPNGKRSIFNLRIDTDFASEKEIESFYQLCLKHEISATWFVETKSAKDRMEQFSQMQNQEIGLHCFQHKVSDKYSFNKSDIHSGTEILNKANIPFWGYAAPYGEWNISQAKAIEQAEFIYSSEFSLDYDNLPFFPYLNDHFSSALQIPVHPISLGRLKNAMHSEMEIKNYYKNVIRNRIDHDQPIFIYDHPTSANVNSINWLVEYIHKQNIQNCSLRDYAQWWKKRLEVKWGAKFNNGKVEMQWPQVKPSIYLNIKKSPQEVSVVKITKVINLNDIKWEKKKLSSVLTTPISVRIKPNRKMIFNDILYFYKRLTQ